MNKKDIIFSIYTLLIISLFVFNTTRQFIETSTINHPFLLGFIKTAILASTGEILASRIITKKYFSKSGMFFRFLVWGFLGLGFVLMFHIYAQGVKAAFDQGLLSYLGASKTLQTVILAFSISLIMNLTFAPAFMLLHRVTDTYLDLTKGRLKKVSLGSITSHIDWKNYFEFVIIKTIPLFWIPAHTITFLLPEHYRVLMAGLLSIALGLILSLSKLKSKKPQNQPESLQ